MTLYIDPSINSLGWAEFKGRTLRAAGTVKTRETVLDSKFLELIREAKFLGRPSHVVVEWPERAWKARAVDLAKIGAAVGLFLGRLDPDEITLVTPFQWKGNLPKNVTNNHMREILSPEEHQRISHITHSPDMYDAICIGLYHTGRATWRIPPTSQSMKTNSKNSKRSTRKTRKAPVSSGSSAVKSKTKSKKPAKRPSKT